MKEMPGWMLGFNGIDLLYVLAWFVSTCCVAYAFIIYIGNKNESGAARFANARRLRSYSVGHSVALIIISALSASQFARGALTASILIFLYAGFWIRKRERELLAKGDDAMALSKKHGEAEAERKFHEVMATAR